MHTCDPQHFHLEQLTMAPPPRPSRRSVRAARRTDSPAARATTRLASATVGIYRGTDRAQVSGSPIPDAPHRCRRRPPLWAPSWTTTARFRRIGRRHVTPEQPHPLVRHPASLGRCARRPAVGDDHMKRHARGGASLTHSSPPPSHSPLPGQHVQFLWWSSRHYFRLNAPPTGLPRGKGTCKVSGNP